MQNSRSVTCKNWRCYLLDIIDIFKGGRIVGGQNSDTVSTKTRSFLSNTAHSEKS